MEINTLENSEIISENNQNYENKDNLLVQAEQDKCK
jgi:hypothetical protein